VDAAPEFIPVANYPGGNGTKLDFTSAVYVEKLDRIYIFGGETHDDAYSWEHRIWYIELSPPGLNCLPKTDHWRAQLSGPTISLQFQRLQFDISQFVNFPSF
jgi:hypothetical protein